jgi:hypothetical protein
VAFRPLCSISKEVAIMRRVILTIGLIVLALGFVEAQTDPFMPPNPITMAMGGAYTANAEGFNAFFYNPAGFARNSEFTLFSTNVYGVLDKKLYDMAVKAVKAVAENKDPVEAMLSKNLSARAREGFDPSALADTGLTVDPDTLEAVTSTATDLTEYLTDVAATANGPAAIQAGLDAIIANPDVAATLVAAGIDVTDPDVVAELAANPQTAAAALLPALLDNPELIAELTDTFVNTVEQESGVTPPPSVANAGATLQDALDEVVSSLTDFLPSGNANVGAMLGMGYVGNGLGIGLFANVNAGLYTPSDKSILSSLARANTFLTFAGGYALKIGDDLRIGAQVRPTIMGYISFLPASLLTKLLSGGAMDQSTIIAAMMSNGIYKGFRIGLDLGVLWDIGDFTVGATLKDIIPNTEVYMRYTDFDGFVADLPNFKGATADDTAYHVPPFKLNLGFQWHPDLGTFNDIIDPRIGLDLMDVLGWARQLPADTSTAATLEVAKAKAAMMSDYDFLQMINLGAQLKFFKFITLSAGIGQGMFTGGLGLKLFIVDINAAVSARYKFDKVTGQITSKDISDFSEVGFSLELALLRL